MVRAEILETDTVTNEEEGSISWCVENGMLMPLVQLKICMKAERGREKETTVEHK